MKNGLFRREVLESRQQLWLGEIHLARPLPLTLLTVGAAAVAVAVAAFVFFGEYTRKARIVGVLVPEQGVVRLVPTQPAIVLERRVAEGEAVRKGDTLFVLSVEQTSSNGDTQAAVQRSLGARERSLHDAALQQRALVDSRRVSLQRRVSDMQAETGSIDSRIELQRQRLVIAQQEVARFESLRDQQYVSAALVQAKSAELLAAQGALEELRAKRAVHLREITALQAELRELPLLAEARRGEIERDIAELAQVTAESEARRRIVVTAPADGVVSAVQAEPGQAVSPAMALASLVPAAARMHAYLYASSKAVGFVRPRQEVLLRYQSFPYQKFGHQKGEVLQVSRTPLPSNELGLAPGAAEPLYRITVALERQSVMAYGEAQPLVPGMQLEADVLLDRRRLIEWIFEPVLGIAGRV